MLQAGIFEGKAAPGQKLVKVKIRHERGEILRISEKIKAVIQGSYKDGHSKAGVF